MQIKKLITPIGAIITFLAAFGFIVFSKWFEESGTAVRVLTVVLCCTYFIATCLAYRFWRGVNLPSLVKLALQSFIFAVIAWLTDEFAEHHPEAFLFLAFIVASIHLFLASQVFEIHEDYGLLLGIITVATAVVIHLTHIIGLKIFFMLIGGVTLACVSNFQRKKETAAIRDDLAASITDAPAAATDANQHHDLISRGTSTHNLEIETIPLEVDTSGLELLARAALKEETQNQSMVQTLQPRFFITILCFVLVSLWLFFSRVLL